MWHQLQHWTLWMSLTVNNYKIHRTCHCINHNLLPSCTYVIDLPAWGMLIVLQSSHGWHMNACCCERAFLNRILSFFTQNTEMCEGSNWLFNVFTLFHKWAVNVLFRTLSDSCLNLNSAHQCERWLMASCVQMVSLLYPANTQIPRSLCTP